MYIKFWGTRGSIPTPQNSYDLRDKYRTVLEGAIGLDLKNSAEVERYLDRLPISLQQPIGGNTTCLEVCSGEQRLIIDAGSGVRLLGIELMKQGYVKGNKSADFLFTHTHWDHIQGFPFFQPAFIPSNVFTMHSPFIDLEERLIRQQHAHFFPVPMSYMNAEFQFKHIAEETWHQIGNFRIYALRLSHPGVTYGYRIEADNSCMVLATDSEYKRVSPEDTKHFVEFFKNADLLIFDAQYSLSEVLDKPDWGHSTAMMGAELAYRANVKRLALFHHDPTSNDDQVWQQKDQAEAYLLGRQDEFPTCEVFVAYDNLCLEI